jgi:hypothetical protein
MRTATPEALVVNHDGILDASAGVFFVTTEPGAMAGISRDGQFLGSAIADDTGLAAISFDPADLGPLGQVTLTATGFNRIPSLAQIRVQSNTTSALDRFGGAFAVQNQPNPFVRSTEISFSIDREQPVSLEIFDVAGRKIRTLHDGSIVPGIHRVRWDGADDAGGMASAGTYFFRIETRDGIETKRMVLLR